MYKVYFNDRLLSLVPDQDFGNNAEVILRLSGEEDSDQLWTLIDAFRNNVKTSTLCLKSPYIDITWKHFCELFVVLEAAGGVVFNQYHQLLMIYRNGYWDLPKGKIEKGEEPDTAAIREVFEECGVGNLQLSKQLATTFHVYPFKEEMVLKKTFWFLMKSEDPGIPVPQLEEGITEVKWMNRLELEKSLQQSYASISDLLKEQVLNDHAGLLG